MRYLIIGLGIYGENLARDLVAMGHDVIGADSNPAAVESLKNDISTVYLIDSTDESQLAVLPLGNVDLVIVAIGENFGASIKTVALLKKMGVHHIYARAIDTLHEAILESFGLDRIITPEQRAANDLSFELALGPGVRTLGVGDDNAVINAPVPEYLTGLGYGDVATRLLEESDLQLVAVCRPAERTNLLGARHKRLVAIDAEADTATTGDVLTIYGLRKKLKDWCCKM